MLRSNPMRQATFAGYLELEARCKPKVEVYGRLEDNAWHYELKLGLTQFYPGAQT
ncbi:MAG TPA: hypothetical protein VFS50_17755 [Meiothermus sp.]|jgi:hypothetical protein|nr:hypothetical protein [Meiothermus sp.]